MTVGVVVHSDSTVSGHGPGVTALLSGPASCLCPVRDNRANIAFLYQRRDYITPRARTPLAAPTRLTKPPQHPKNTVYVRSHAEVS